MTVGLVGIKGVGLVGLVGGVGLVGLVAAGLVAASSCIQLQPPAYMSCSCLIASIEKGVEKAVLSGVETCWVDASLPLKSRCRRRVGLVVGLKTGAAGELSLLVS